MVLGGGGWTGKSWSGGEAGESWEEGAEGTALSGVEFGDRVPRGGPDCLPLDPGCSCLSDSACLIPTCKSLARSFISFLLLFLQVYLISFELPLQTRKCPKEY